MVEQTNVIQLWTNGEHIVEFIFPDLVSKTEAASYFPTAKNRAGNNPQIKAHGPLGEKLIIGGLNVRGVLKVYLTYYTWNITKAAGFTWAQTLEGLVIVMQKVFEPNMLDIVPYREPPAESAQDLMRFIHLQSSTNGQSSQAQHDEENEHQKFLGEWAPRVKGLNLDL